jgi:hypothetical protein
VRDPDVSAVPAIPAPGGHLPSGASPPKPAVPIPQSPSMIVALRPPFACVERDAPSRPHHHRHGPRPPARAAPSAPVPGGLRTFSLWPPGPPALTDCVGRTPSPCAHTGRQKHSARFLRHVRRLKTCDTAD